MRRIFLWSGIIIGLGLLVWGLAVLGSKSPTSGTGPVSAVTEQDHLRGSATAPAILIEYSDFQCPACGAYEPIIRALKEKYGDKLTLVYRYFPLRGVHQYADISSQAGEAASLQGKFWEYHDILFDRQNSWPQGLNVKQVLIDYAKELGMNSDQFATDIDSKVVKDRVQRDVDSGTSAKIDSTPTFFLNGKHIANPANLNDFSALIDGVINK